MSEVQKLSVSFPEDLASGVKDATRHAGTSVSAWLADAAEQKLRHEAALEALRRYEEEHGEVTEEELASSGSRTELIGAAAEQSEKSGAA